MNRGGDGHVPGTSRQQVRYRDVAVLAPVHGGSIQIARPAVKIPVTRNDA
jgi:hypothetical protein